MPTRKRFARIKHGDRWLESLGTDPETIMYIAKYQKQRMGRIHNVRHVRITTENIPDGKYSTIRCAIPTVRAMTNYYCM